MAVFASIAANGSNFDLKRLNPYSLITVKEFSAKLM
jgi:hypothetical protein